MPMYQMFCIAVSSSGCMILEHTEEIESENSQTGSMTIEVKNVDGITLWEIPD